MQFAPARGRGLKLCVSDFAPLPSVRPRAGAWIETLILAGDNLAGKFAPARGRGLKRLFSCSAPGGRGSPPRGGVD